MNNVYNHSLPRSGVGFLCCCDLLGVICAAPSSVLLPLEIPAFTLLDVGEGVLVGSSIGLLTTSREDFGISKLNKDGPYPFNSF